MINFDKMPNTVAIVGSRSFYKNRNKVPLGDKRMNKAVTRFVDKLGSKREIVSGGAVGVDTYARDAAKKFGNTYTEFSPQGDLSDPKTYYQRNKDIVSYTTRKSGLVVAFIDATDYRGTNNTLIYAKKVCCDILVFRFNPDGSFINSYSTDWGLIE